MGVCKTALEIWKADFGNRIARQHRGPGEVGDHEVLVAPTWDMHLGLTWRKWRVIFIRGWGCDGMTTGV